MNCGLNHIIILFLSICTLVVVLTEEKKRRTEIGLMSSLVKTSNNDKAPFAYSSGLISKGEVKILALKKNLPVIGADKKS